MARIRPPVSLITCREMPEPDADAHLLLDSLAAANLDARWVAWEDVDAVLSPTVILRSTWNYHHHLERFLGWTSSVSGALWNPAAVVRWNAHKRYLLDLQERGVAVVPTRLLQRGGLDDLERVAESLGTADVVVKPAVSAGSYRTYRSRGSIASIEADFGRLRQDRDVLVQPYVAAVEVEGERSLVWIDGEVTHAVRKSPRFNGDSEDVRSVPVSEEERAFAQRVIDAAPGPLLYARVDVVRDPVADQLLLMELELIEPSLFLGTSTAGLWRFVDAVARKAHAGAEPGKGRRSHGGEEMEA